MMTMPSGSPYLDAINNVINECIVCKYETTWFRFEIRKLE